MTEPPSPTPPPDPAAAQQPGPAVAAGGRGGAALVALGILSSRLVGFVREFAVAHFFGVGPHADVFRAALRAPNAIQNLLGEGTLSAAFIPLYTRMIHEGREEEAGRFAGAVFGLLLAVAGGFSLLGALLARPIVAVLSAGFLRDSGPVDRYELAVDAVRIIFPMTGFLVLSVWALGILNSHRKFLVPYIAPVAWNAAIIAAMLWAGGSVSRESGGGGLSLAALDRLLFAACWGALAGGLLQFLVQLPVVARVLRGFRLSFSTRVPGVPEALRAFGPVVAGRGVVQLAGYLDQFLASFLAMGAVSALGYAQMFYMLPISLFAMSVAAAELPELARLGAGAPELVPRVRRSLRQMAFLNVPTFVGYLAFGVLIVGIYRTGRFTAANQWLVYLVLCGYTAGLLATTSSRLLQNTFYALGETAVPARIAAWRVGLSAAVGLLLMWQLDRVPLTAVVAVPGGEALRLGAVGLAFASGVGAWFELLRLQAALARRGAAGAVPWKETGRLLLLAGAAAAVAAGIWGFLPRLHVAIEALVVVGSFGLVYLGLSRWLAAEELSFWIGRFGRRLRR